MDRYACPRGVVVIYVRVTRPPCETDHLLIRPRTMADMLQRHRAIPPTTRLFGLQVPAGARSSLVNHGDYCRYRTTSRVASSMSAPNASSERLSEWCVLGDAGR